VNPDEDPLYWPVFGFLLLFFVIQVTSTFYDCPHAERRCCGCKISTDGFREVTHFPHVLRCWTRTIRRRRSVA
jgi:hypothetical protein